MSDFDPYQQWLGIPREEQPPDHYRLLGVRRFESDANAIQDAADRRMAAIRVYQTGPRGQFTQKLLNELAAAKLCLLNPFSKSEYDASLSSAGYAPIADTLLPESVPDAPSHPHQSNLPIGYQPGVPASPYPYMPATAETARPFNQPPHGSTAPAAFPLQTRGHGHRRRKTSNFGVIAVSVFAVVALGLVGWFGRQWLRDQESVAVGPNETQESGQSSQLPPISESPNASSTEGGIVQDGSGSIFLPMSAAQLQGDVTLDSRPIGDLLTGWKSDDATATWEFKTTKLPSQGIFGVRVQYQAAQDAEGAEYVITIDGEEHKQDVRARGRLLYDELFIAIKQPGQHTLTFAVHNKPPSAVFGLKLLELSPPRL